MEQIEHFLFFPVVVLVAMILIVLTWKVLVRLVSFFIILLLIWYALSYVGAMPSPTDVLKEYRRPPAKSGQLAHCSN